MEGANCENNFQMQQQTRRRLHCI